jgi:hypothetical protein
MADIIGIGGMGIDGRVVGVPVADGAAGVVGVTFCA